MGTLLRTLFRRPAPDPVARGAALLDAEDRLWYLRVNPETLDMASNSECVLGQLHSPYGTPARTTSAWTVSASADAPPAGTASTFSTSSISGTARRPRRRTSSSPTGGPRSSATAGPPTMCARKGWCRPGRQPRPAMAQSVDDFYRGATPPHDD
jgi:hypothetical protein